MTAKRAQGKHKTKLKLDPVRGPVVALIYAWRVDEHLGYRAIAERLNTDLDRYPPPQPVDPERAVGRWTGSAVREILCNLKYTGQPRQRVIPEGPRRTGWRCCGCCR